MRKFFNGLYFIAMAVLVLSLSGCNGSSNSLLSSSKPAVKEVAVLSSPVFQQGSSYKIYKGASVNIDGARCYVAPNIGTDESASTLNLGFTDNLTDSLVIVDNSDNTVVFAYDPSGSGTKTTGTITFDETVNGGKRLKYDGLTITSAFFTSLNVDTSSRKVIVLNSSTGKATIDGVEIPEYDYVWHADPNHKDEYYTKGINGTTEMTESEMLANIPDKSVYVARDVRYLTSDLTFTGTAANDEEQEYAAYYSSTVQEEVAATMTSDTMKGPYIFATLPMSEGAGGMPGGGEFPGGEFPGGGGSDSGDRPSFPGGEGPGGQMPGGQRPGANMTASNVNTTVSNSDIAYFESMTHTASEAYANRVLHITEPGIYELQGTWNGQIWIEIGEEETDKAVIILNNVSVTCDVAPALVFREVYECGPEDEDTVNSTWNTTLGDTVINNAGAMVIIADDSTNTFTGANVYRMLKPQAKKDSVTTIDGTDVSQQKKRYKMDGAFYSFASMAMGGGTKGNGVLNVNSSTYEGFGTEMHMAFDSGVLTVTAPEDGMNFNEDDISTFVMLGGNLTVEAQGGDGIDSNGYIAIIDADKLDVTAKQDSNQDNAGADGPLDADKDVYISDSARANYTHQAYSGGSTTPTTPTNPASGDNTPEVPDKTDSEDQTPEVPDKTDSEDQTPDNSDENNSDENKSDENKSDENNSSENETPETITLTTENGTTTISLGSSTTIEADTDTSPRGIATSDNVFRITRKVNTFSGITEE